jgi:hypothetical protein
LRPAGAQGVPGVTAAGAQRRYDVRVSPSSGTFGMTGNPNGRAREETMMSMKITKAVVLATLATVAGAGAMLTSGQAEARASRFEQWTYESKGPLKGYEGFLFPGYYCSYRRFPVRTCEYDKHGREICKITSWRLEQSCS